MSKNSVKSFTLAELLVVMIITVIVVGIAFSVLRFVQREIEMVRKNFEKSISLSLFEQQLCIDFNKHNKGFFMKEENCLLLMSEIDTVAYLFKDEYVISENDTIKLRIELGKLYFNGIEVKEGEIDALSIDGNKEIPEFAIFISRQNDISTFMNTDGI